MSGPGEAVRPALESLRAYMHRLYPDEPPGRFPLEFWKLDDDELFYEALGYLPLHLGMTDRGRLPECTGMPEGFRLAYPVFHLEDDYDFNGWTALTNAGEHLLPHAIAAYDRIGMAPEARALEAALGAIRKDPDDEEAAERAFKSVANPYRDDEAKYDALLAFFRTNSHLFEG